ncbi:MAG: hypothetical protein SH809_19000 [Rhodothermales bacterium]|nr:hypothetical protein [Rhodothermales bacterium]
MTIKIPGPGCGNCRNLERNSREALGMLALFFSAPALSIMALGYTFNLTF